MTAVSDVHGVTASISDRKRSRRVCFFFAAYSCSEKLDCIKDSISFCTCAYCLKIHLVRLNKSALPKNYLNEEELRALNNPAEQYLIFAEGQAARHIAMTMQDWISKLEGFLTLNDREILQGAGKVLAELAKAHAEQEFDKFRMLDDQRFESDFDRMVKQLPARKQRKDE